MKKILAVGIVIIGFLAALYFFNNIDQKSFLDTRFWFNDIQKYRKAYNGDYLVGVDIEPGIYDLEIRGGCLFQSRVIIYKSVESMENGDDPMNSVVVARGTKGIHFSADDGNLLRVNVQTRDIMRFHKIS